MRTPSSSIPIAGLAMPRAVAAALAPARPNQVFDGGAGLWGLGRSIGLEP